MEPGKHAFWPACTPTWGGYVSNKLLRGPEFLLRVRQVAKAESA